MVASLLKLQNDALKKTINSSSLDLYYEEVINGMQIKIEELMDNK
jgi:hypothetical protein